MSFSTEQRQYNVDAKLVPLGYEQITSLSSAQGLQPPAKTRVAVIQAVTQNVRWRDDGTDPTAAIGMQLAVGRDMLYTGNLAAIRFIEEAASAEINVSYYF
jgi:hypothetical protein